MKKLTAFLLFLPLFSFAQPELKPQHANKICERFYSISNDTVHVILLVKHQDSIRTFARIIEKRVKGTTPVFPDFKQKATEKVEKKAIKFIFMSLPDKEDVYIHYSLLLNSRLKKKLRRRSKIKLKGSFNHLMHNKYTLEKIPDTKVVLQ